MRILYLADIRFPLERANGIQTFETCRGLAGRGHPVTLLVRPDTAAPPRDPWVFYGADPLEGLSIVGCPGAPAPVRRGAYLAAALRRGLGRAADVILTRDLGIAAALVRLPRRLRPPVVYEAHGFAPTVSEELPRLLGTARVPSRTKLARLAAREARVWRDAEGYVTLTAAHRDELVARFGARGNTAVVPDGTRLPIGRVFTPPAGSVPIVGYAGHLYPWKGADVLVEALARLDGAHGLIVGGHPGERDVGRVDALIRARGLAVRVQLIGWQSPAAVADQLARCTVLVLPNTRSTISERYTSPLKLFEYMAAGRAIVASDLPALREVLTDGVDALLVTPGQPDALAAAIARLLADPALAERLARRAFEAASAFGWDSRASRLEAVLDAAERAS